MRLLALVFGILLIRTTAAAAEPPKPAPKEAAIPPELKDLIDNDTAEVLRRINGLTPYQVPDLRLKQDTVYANTPVDYEPYGAIKPYKEHFLKQMEYTGAGRSIPEPGPELKTVKIGFIGPIMSDRLGGHGRQES